MAELHCMPTADIPAGGCPSPRSLRSPASSSPHRLVRDAEAILAYERFLRLPELSSLCGSAEFPGWTNEPLVRPALQALEVTFRLVPLALSDRRMNRLHDWQRRLESLACRQVDIIAAICEDEDEPEPGPSSSGAGAPVVDLADSQQGLLPRERERGPQEVWAHRGRILVSHNSAASLLPRLASWPKSQPIASAISRRVEREMGRRCPFTLGLGEPNLAAKPSLDYDLVVRPAELHSLKKCPPLTDDDDQKLSTIQQIVESWLFAARQLLRRTTYRIQAAEFEAAAGDCSLLERIWKLLAELEDLHLLMDPEDLLRLKSRLATKHRSPADASCFRSRALIEATELCRDLKQSRVPPQSAAGGDEKGRISLVLGLQGVETAMGEFCAAYQRLMTAVVGNATAVLTAETSSDS